MAITTYYIVRYPVTGTQDSPETITYASLTDKITDETLDTTLTGIETVGVVGRWQTRSANIVEGSITTTNFQIAMSDMGDIPLSGTGYFDFLIVVEE